MSESIHITSLQLENVKRVQAVTMEPTASGLNIIGGKNGQGKTSVLDAIAWALGGEKYRPENAKREGANFDPHLRVTLSNGIVVERKGVRSALTVTDPTGKKAGQQLLNEFIGAFALDLPKFMDASDKDKAKALLGIIGVEDELIRLEREEQEATSERLLAGREAKRAKAYADSLQFFEGAPDEEVSVTELIQQQQDILKRNAANERMRRNAASIDAEVNSVAAQIEMMQEQLEELRSRQKACHEAADNLVDESTAELEASIANVEAINHAVRTNRTKHDAQQKADAAQREWDAYTQKIADVQKQRNALLEQADMPLPGLSVQDGKLTYNNQPWGNMSGSEQLRVATAIVHKLNPNCGFVLMDKLEQMDTDTLLEFGEWLESEGLQAIATRVSTGGECSIIIEDGMGVVPAKKPQLVTPTKWTAGAF